MTSLNDLEGSKIKYLSCDFKVESTVADSEQYD